MANIGLLVISILLLGAGTVQLVWPRKIAAHKTQWDAIRGSDQNTIGKPGNWMVKYARFGGLLFTGSGTLLLLFSLGFL